MIVVSGPNDYFNDRMKYAMTVMGIIVPMAPRAYLVDLLVKHAHEDIGSKAIVFDLINATEAVSPGQKLKQFKQMGDRSLMLAGVWPTSVSRKLNGIDYYMTMGRIGYNSASALLRSRIMDEHFAALYADLGRNFDRYCDVVSVMVAKPNL
jgi:hypothetical protein